MFERFTGRARQVVVLAQEESIRLGHGYIGTEHLLLGLAAEGQGLAARVLAQAGIELDELRGAVAECIGRAPAGIDAGALAAIGIDLDEVRRRVEDAFGPGALERTKAGCRPFLPRAKRALELALREAKELGHGYIGTEHILLGLSRGDGVAHALLEERGLTHERVLALVREALAA